MTQQQRILHHLEHFGTITQSEAIDFYGIYRLTARIWDLKHGGHLIRTERVSGINRYGEATSYARYRLVR